MRIIAGKFRGRKIDFVSDEKTRPTADMVREAFFCKIQFEIQDSIFLDLFAGSGAIGLEALSRGAKEVYFVENDRKNLEIIKQNLKTLYGENYEKSAQEQGQQVHLINSDYSNFLDKISVSSRAQSRDLVDSEKKCISTSTGDFSTPLRFGRNDTVTFFDFVYIDPPYKSDFYEVALRKLKENNLVSSESLIICEHEHKEKSKNCSFGYKGYELISQKKYGIKMLSYFKSN